MGRVKLKLKTVDSETGRIVTYSKRKNALLKKTNELSVLCEIDVFLLMFSPTGRIALQMGDAVKFDQIIRRFAKTSAEERARSNIKVFETLKKSYKNSDHEVQATFFSGTRSQSVEELNAQSNLLQNQLARTQQRLRDWRNPDKIESIELLRQMEDYLKGLFDKIKSQKNQINLASSAVVEQPSGGGKCRNKSSMSNQNFNVKRADSHMRIAGNDFQRIASTPKSKYLSQSLHCEQGVLRNDSRYLASMPRPNSFQRNEDRANNLLLTELLRSELQAMKQQAHRNEFSKSDYLINAYTGAEYFTNDFKKKRSEALRNNNEVFKADSPWFINRQQSPCPDQCTFSFNQQNIVPFQLQAPCEQKDTDHSFDEGNLGSLSSNHDPVLEWSGSFGDLDFVLSDYQQPLSVDDYESEVFAQPTDQPKLPDIIAISGNEAEYINF